MRLGLSSQFWDLNFKEKAMRTVLAMVAVMFLASCATAATNDTAKVTQYKYGQTYTVKKQPESEFAGAGVKASESATATGDPVKVYRHKYH
jgi:hypothetical protein